MKRLFLTKEQEIILNLQKAYPESGICNIGGIVKADEQYNHYIALQAFRYAIEHIHILQLQFDNQYHPYFSSKKVILQEWKSKTRPSMEELSEWLDIPFTFFYEPLYEFRYYRKGKILEFYIKIHHVVMDGYSIALAAQKFLEIYRLMQQEEKSLENLECMLDMCKPVKIAAKDWEWLQKLEIPHNPECWQIKKPCHGKIQAMRKVYHLPEKLYKEMMSVGKEMGISTEILLTAALGIYISNITGSETVAVGRSMLNRRKREMNVLGMKVNTLPILMQVKKDENFFTLCKEIKAFFYDMMSHSAAPFHEYLEKEQRNGLFYDIMISYRSEKYIPFLEGVEQKEIPGMKLELPMRIFINEFSKDIRLEIQYQTSCYTSQEVKAFWERILIILKQGLSGAMIKDISILSLQDELVWKEFNKTQNNMPIPELMLPDRIQRQALYYGDRKSAIVFEEKSISYNQLEEAATVLASWLAESGIHSGDVVGIQMESSVLLPVAFYGIWKAGAAFLPISMKESEARKKKIASFCKKILTDVEVKRGIQYGKRIALPQIYPDMIAYYMFTSGSTGEPKAVMISHKSLACRLVWMQETYHCFGSVLQKASYTFDVSMWEYFLPLMEGGTLFLTREEEHADSKSLLKLLEKYQIKTVHFVPSLLSVFLDYAEKKKNKLPDLKHVFSSGEALSAELVKQFYRVFPQTKLHNLYGPTECTIDVSYYDCNGEERQVPIGRPVFWTKIEVIGKDGICLPPGIEGELSIRGELVGEGYYQVESEKYRKEHETLEKIYDTGDRAVLGMDGLLYYKGRNDQQCKINGIRVDLGQIESVMLQCAGVLRAAVIKKENSLTGFYMAKTLISDLSEKMLEILPSYSVPRQLIYMNEIPLTANGKTDKKYLEQFLKSDSIVLPKTREEQLLYNCLKEKLGSSLSVEENLFLAGLDSLVLMEVILELEEKGICYTPEDFYQNLTIREIAKSAGTGCQWLHKKNAKKLVLAFPYAAGTAEAYRPLADKLQDYGIDFCVVRNPQKLPATEKYHKIVLLGYCTGTATALKALHEMKGKNVCGIILCAAIPPGKALKRTGSPWEKIPDRGIEKLLDYLHGKPIHASKSMIQCFRKDAKSFFSFFQLEYNRKVPQISLFFGEKDILTWLSRKKWKRWLKYLSGNVHVCVWRGEGHFFLEQRCGELVYEIRRIIQRKAG